MKITITSSGETISVKDVRAIGLITIAAVKGDDGADGANGSGSAFIDDSEAAGIYGDLSGAIDGSNTQYTVSQSAYASGTLEILLNGQDQKGSDITETTPASGIFDLSFAPASGTYIKVKYA